MDLHLILQNFEEAEKIVNSMIYKNPKDATLYSALGSIYEKKGDLKKAEKFTRKALDMDSKLYSARSNLATIRQHYGDHLKARTIYEELIKEDNENPDANNNLGNLYLMIGQFSIGWKKYDFRWKVFPLSKATWPIQDRELWQGQDGKKLLLWKEQGIGDDILFLGLVMEAYKRTRVLTVYTDSRLISLCERGMPGVVFKPYKNKIDDEDFDYHLPMGSLPRLFRSDIKDFENTVTGYLKADKERVESLREELGLGDKKVVGISWKSIKSLHTQKKSLSLKEFGTLFKDLDIVLLNLQYGDVDNEIKEFTKSTGIEVLQCGSVDNREDLDGLAALIELCDLVVSTSNVTVHLAGALGKETWVLLPYVANFWWLLDRTDSIWYPTLRLYRQKKFQDWSTIPQDVKRDLERKFFS